MTVVTIHVAKTKLSQLLAWVEAGEEIVVARGKTQIAKGHITEDELRSELSHRSLLRR